MMYKHASLRDKILEGVWHLLHVHGRQATESCTFKLSWVGIEYHHIRFLEAYPVGACTATESSSCACLYFSGAACGPCICSLSRSKDSPFARFISRSEDLSILRRWPPPALAIAWCGRPSPLVSCSLKAPATFPPNPHSPAAPSFRPALLVSLWN